MKLGFIILAHDQPASIRRLAGLLATGENRVVVHFDSGATAENQKAVLEVAAEFPGKVSVISEVHCVWGEWSLVEAVLRALREFASMPEPPDYIHLMSGADLPIRPVSDLEEFLRRNPEQDFIECCDITQRAWVKGGLGRERFRFYFPFNFRTSRRAFDRLVRWQRKLKIRRKMPLGLTPHMGSQWWTLRWSTCEKVLEFVKKHPEVPRFFRSTWIPDESFFQTVIAKVVPRREIADLQLMFHHLGLSGRPYVFYNDHLDLVNKLPHFFIRKVSPAAKDLIDGLVLSPRHRPLPRPKHLAHVRDLLRARIDANHYFEERTPGHLELKPVVEKKIESIPGPLVVLLVQGEGEIPSLAAAVTGNPRCFWLGRPYAPRSVKTPAEGLLRMGMSEQSWQLRDTFPKDFIARLASCPPDGRIPVIAVVLKEDDLGLGALALAREVVLLAVSGQAHSPHRFSLVAGALEAVRPGLAGRVAHVEPADIPGILEDFARDPQR